MSKRRNGESSIFPYRNGYAAYAWVTTPDGERKRKWVYGKTHDEVHAKWIRVGRELLRREVKTETSEAPLSLPEICVAALKLRREQQETDRSRAGGAWVSTGLVFTTRHGTALEPRNFSRSFDRCIAKARGAPDHRARHPQDLRVFAGCPGRAPACGDADPAAQQDRRHDGDLHRGSLGRHPRCAQEAGPVARQLARCCT